MKYYADNVVLTILQSPRSVAESWKLLKILAAFLDIKIKKENKVIKGHLIFEKENVI